jgi:hypothetical protein
LAKNIQERVAVSLAGFPCAFEYSAAGKSVHAKPLRRKGRIKKALATAFPEERINFEERE